jgi:hypothetical protein
MIRVVLWPSWLAAPLPRQDRIPNKELETAQLTDTQSRREQSEEMPPEKSARNSFESLTPRGTALLRVLLNFNIVPVTNFVNSSCVPRGGPAGLVQTRFLATHGPTPVLGVIADCDCRAETLAITDPFCCHHAEICASSD